MWVLLAAAESTGDASVVRGAARALGLPESASAEAEELRLVEVRESVRFRHPLVRSAVYNSATDADRRAVHAALRDETSARGLRELAAWHAAAACSRARRRGRRRARRDRRPRRRARRSALPRPPARPCRRARPQSSRRAASGSSARPRPPSAPARGCCRVSCSPGRTVRCSTPWAGGGCWWSRRCAPRIWPIPPRSATRRRTCSRRRTSSTARLPTCEQKALVIALNSALTVEDRAVGTDLQPPRRADPRREREPPSTRYAVTLRSRRLTGARQLRGRASRSCARRSPTLDSHGRRGRSSTSASTRVVPCIAAWDCDAASRLLAANGAART